MHQRQVIDHAGHVGEDLRDPCARLPVLMELPAGTQQVQLVFHESLHESEALALEKRVRSRLAVKLAQLGSVEPCLELARRAGHEKVDDALDLGSEMRRLGRQRVLDQRYVASRQLAVAEQTAQSDVAEADEALAEEVSPGSVTQAHLLHSEITPV